MKLIIILCYTIYYIMYYILYIIPLSNSLLHTEAISLNVKN